MWLIALLAGACLPFAFAPFNIYMLAFFMPAILLYLWLQSSAKHAFLRGLSFGIGFFTIGNSWIYISVHNFGNATPLLAAFLTGLLILLMSLYFALQGYVLRRFFKEKNNLLICLCAFPATWALLEYIRSFLFDGFPFLFLGYSQITTPFSGLAPMIGVYGLSLLTAFISGTIVLIFQRISLAQKLIGVVVTLLCLLLGSSYQGHAWTKPFGKPIQLSLIQGNIPQLLKWDSNALNSILTKYITLTTPHWNSALIVWPEGAVPIFPNQLPDFFNDLAERAQRHHTTLIVGAPLEDATTNTYYNGLLMLGKNHGSYRKRHLVPFGEFIPLQWLYEPLIKKLNIPMSNLSAGPQQQSALLFNDIPIATFICYETAFPIEALNEMQGKALAVNIVDDAWFGHSIAAAQQLQMTQMRALETGRAIAITANTGITALINPLGQVTHALPINTAGTLTAQTYAVSGNTPLLRFNYYPVLIIGIILMLLVLIY